MLSQTSRLAAYGLAALHGALGLILFTAPSWASTVFCLDRVAVRQFVFWIVLFSPAIAVFYEYFAAPSERKRKPDGAP